MERGHLANEARLAVGRRRNLHLRQRQRQLRYREARTGLPTDTPISPGGNGVPVGGTNVVFTLHLSYIWLHLGHFLGDGVPVAGTKLCSGYISSYY